jgi:hypothetical protein
MSWCGNRAMYQNDSGIQSCQIKIPFLEQHALQYPWICFLPRITSWVCCVCFIHMLMHRKGFYFWQQLYLLCNPHTAFWSPKMPKYKKLGWDGNPADKKDHVNVFLPTIQGLYVPFRLLGTRFTIALSCFEPGAQEPYRGIFNHPVFLPHLV